MGKRIVVVGGGPGGYVAAIRAAQLGAEVHLAEEDRLGGTCLNVGCIPTKALLHVGGFYEKAAANAVAGVRVAGVSLDWSAAQAHKAAVVDQLTSGVAGLLRHNGVTVHRGRASLLPGRRVRVGETTLEADAVVLATGSESAGLKVPGADLEGVVDSTGALALDQVPASLVIVGGGVVGVEFAALFSALGTKVTVVELLEEILPPVDTEIAAFLRGALEEKGAEIRTGAELTGIAGEDGGLAVTFQQAGQARTVTAERVLMAVGRRPKTAGLGLEELGVRLERGAVAVDEHFESSVPGVYAVGDCNGRCMLAHAAMAQGIAAVEHILGAAPHGSAAAVPSCVYTSPEVACVGLTEAQAERTGRPFRVGRFSLSGNGKALIDGSEGGLVKIIADAELGEVLGVHMAGPRVTEIIAEAVLCMGMEGTVEDLVRAIHAHPTVGEAVGEAARAVFGAPIHGV